MNRQERVVEEVKLVIKPHYNKKSITKDEYKEILRRTVPKVGFISFLSLRNYAFSYFMLVNFFLQICHSKSGEINPQKIKTFVEAYMKKIRHKR